MKFSLRLLWIAAIFAFGPLLLCSSQADTALTNGGTNAVLTGTGSPYLVTTNITFVNLTIEPGARILVTGPHEIIVTGSLIAQGLPGFPIVFKAATPGARWKGLVITNCVSTNIGYVQVRDAFDSGIRIFGSPMTLVNCDISGNRGDNGAGINTDSPLVLFQCTITNNTSRTSTGRGAGIYSRANLLRLIGGRVANNAIIAEASPSAAYGGGIYCIGIVEATDFCQIVENSCYAHDTPAASSCTSQGGGIWSDSGIRATNALIARNEVRCYGNNHAPSPSGGGIYCSADVTLVSCEVSENTAVNSDGGATYGGGVICRSLTALSSVFRGNTTSAGYSYHSDGGAIRASGVISLYNCLLANNRNTGGTPIQFGSAIYGGDAPASRIENCTIVDNYNSGSDYGALYAYRGPIHNSIIYGNTRSLSGSFPASITYSLIEGGFAGAGNLDTDPLFADHVNYFLQTNSPAVDSGDSDPASNDTGPHALGTARNDMGVYGGPGALPILGFMEPLRILSQPEGRIVTEGATGSFSVSVSSGGPVRYQWRYNGTNVIGQTNSALVLPNVTLQQAGAYSVEVSTTDQMLLSSDALLTVTRLKLYAGVTISGHVGGTYRIEYATAAKPNLWNILTDIVLPSSPYFYLDLDSADSPSRFYRFTLLAP